MHKPALPDRDTQVPSNKELLEEIERLNFFISTAMDLYYEWSSDSDVIRLSENLASILGVTTPNIPNDQYLDRIHADHQEHYRKTVDSHFQNHRNRVVSEYQILNKEADYIWVCEEGVAMRDSDGKAIGYVATLTDISPRKLAEDGLLESNARLLAIMENTSSPISLKDSEGRYVLVNDIFCTQLNLKRHDVIGKTALDLFPREIAEAENHHDQEIIDGQKPMQFELNSAATDDIVRTFISDRFPIFSADKSFIGIGSLNTDITDRKKMEAALRTSEQEMRLLAATDPLTGARNRRSFFDIGNRELARSNRYNRPLTILMIDIDHFKVFNDTYGHAAGDLVLKNFSDECIRTLREQDTLGRLGGEEFGVILPEIDLQTALSIADRIRQNLMDLETLVDDKVLKFTVSIGAGECKSDDTTIDAALGLADGALYQAKQQGRNKVLS